MTTLTAKARRSADAHEYNSNLSACPGHQILTVISDKWATLVIAALADGPLRYGELRRIIAGASAKMLTQTLRRLEREGLVNRTVTLQVPVRVDYELTRLGQSLLPVQRAIRDWAEMHIEDVLAARERYDQVT